MVLTQAKSTKFIGKGCWDQDYESHNPNPSLLAPLISDEVHGKRCSGSALHVANTLLFPELTAFPRGSALFHQRHSVLIWVRSISDVALAVRVLPYRYGYVSVSKVISCFAYVLNARRRKKAEASALED